MKSISSGIILLPILGGLLLMSGFALVVGAQVATRQPARDAVKTVAPGAQSASPLTSAELVRLVRQLPRNPDLKETVMAEIRRRGIAFGLTKGMRSVVATQSGNDALLLRTLDEAERRRTGVSKSLPPPAAEAFELLTRARHVALEQAQQMPDFIVKQQITRSYANGTTKNWIPSDRLTVAVTFRERAGEQYKLLAINGLPVPIESVERDNYEQAKGTSSTGEFASMLAGLFAAESKADFQPVDAETLPQGGAIVYDYAVKKENSKQQIKVGGSPMESARAITVGYRGRVWIDRESGRVWRIENIATDIPEGFPVQAAMNRIEYDWATIDERKYLMPQRAEVELTTMTGDRRFQSRNDIRFRNYRKFGAKVEVLDDELDEGAPTSENPR